MWGMRLYAACATEEPPEGARHLLGAMLRLGGPQPQTLLPTAALLCVQTVLCGIFENAAQEGQGGRCWSLSP